MPQSKNKPQKTDRLYQAGSDYQFMYFNIILTKWMSKPRPREVKSTPEDTDFVSGGACICIYYSLAPCCALLLLHSPTGFAPFLEASGWLNLLLRFEFSAQTQLSQKHPPAFLFCFSFTATREDKQGSNSAHRGAEMQLCWGYWEACRSECKILNGVLATRSCSLLVT